MKYFEYITTLPVWAHICAAFVTFFGFIWIKGYLDASYAASKHPVDYATGQLAFDGETIKSYYIHMLEAGTLDIYRMTQLIDFGFILAMACMGIFVCTLVARVSGEGSWGRCIGLFAGLCVFVGAVCDAIENGWSFIMLANPADFANWLALVYSAFASMKFTLIIVAVLCLIISMVLAIAERVTRRPIIG